MSYFGEVDIEHKRINIVARKSDLIDHSIFAHNVYETLIEVFGHVKRDNWENIKEVRIKIDYQPKIN